MNGVNLTAQYENENTILCIVGSGNVSACMVTIMHELYSTKNTVSGVV